MNKYQEALNYFKDISNDLLSIFDEESMSIHFRELKILQELVDKATPMKPIQLEEGKYSCPSCAMAFKLKTLVKNMFVNNKYCDVCGQALLWEE